MGGHFRQYQPVGNIFLGKVIGNSIHIVQGMLLPCHIIAETVSVANAMVIINVPCQTFIPKEGTPELAMAVEVDVPSPLVFKSKHNQNYLLIEVAAIEPLAII